MQAPALFQFNNYSMRVITDDNGAPWFIARDICDILEIKNPSQALSRLDDDERSTLIINEGLINQGISVNNPGTSLGIINESGLYSLVLRSNKSEAKTFKKWVTSEVLPGIRENGYYSTKNKPTTLIAPLDQAMLFIQMVNKDLNVSDTSKIRGYQVIADAYGMPKNLLPAYTDEKLTRALGDLLKEHGSPLSAIKVNPMLEAIGILEKKDRRSTGKTKKSFWSITDKGLVFGKNETSPQSPNETQPRWYVDKFPQLFSLI